MPFVKPEKQKQPAKTPGFEDGGQKRRVSKMKGYGKHLAASVTVIALFTFCALAMGFAGAPVQDVQGVQGKTFGDTQGMQGAAAVPLPDKVSLAGTAPQVADAGVAEADAPAIAAKPAAALAAKVDDKPYEVGEGMQAVPEAEAAAPKKPPTPGPVVNPPTDLKGAFVPGNPPYVRLEWTSNNDQRNLKGFLVYRVVAGDYVEGQDLTPIGETKKTAYKDYDIKPGLTYRYWVTAVSKSGEESKPSEPVDVATYEDVAPAPPRGVMAGAVDPGVGIDWSPNGEANLLGYNVYRRNARGRFDKLTRDPIADTHYYDKKGVAGDVYAVSAVNGYGRESELTVTEAQVIVPVRHEESDAAIATEGLWVLEAYPEASGGKIRVAGSGGDRLNFRFTGRQVKVYCAKYWTCGSANMYIDGKLVATVNLYSYDIVFQSITLSAPGLAYGQHILTMEALGTGNPEADFNFVNVDAFEVW